MMRVVTSAQMKQIEENSLAYEMTFQRLMENAGSAAAAFIRRTFSVSGRNCMVFCARGNNGGDGFVVARKLAENGANTVIVLLDGYPATEEAAAMFEIAQGMEIPVIDFDSQYGQVAAYLEQADILVDAICGTGFRGELREAHRMACLAINDAIAAVVSLDIPTGVECDTGRADPDCVRADFTVAFDSQKPAHILPGAADLCGQIEVVEIGIPPEAHTGIVPMFGIIETEQVIEQLPQRPPDSHKGTFGTVLNIAGCQQYRGAAGLSTMAALRCGAGRAVLASIEEVCAATAAHLLECTYLPLPRSAVGGIDFDGAAPVLAPAIGGADAVLFGCGLGNNIHTAGLLSYVLENAQCPLVIDADGLNALSGNIHVLHKASAPVILTPHPGEMARLTGLTTGEITGDRQGAAARFAQEHGVTLVLKGAGTVVASPDGGVLLGRTGGPGLAKGGSGDLLAGMIASLLAQGLPPRSAAACAVHLHGLAADRTEKRLSGTSMLPSELLGDLGAIFAEHGR